MFTQKNDTATWDWCSHTSACATNHGVDIAMDRASVSGAIMRHALLAIRMQQHGSRHVVSSMK